MRTRSLPILLFGTLHALFCAAKPPNVVFIVLDDLGYADVGFTQETPLAEVKTPNIDALARQGVIFTNGYSSGEVCAPTRAGFMLGQYQQGVGIYSAQSGGGERHGNFEA